MIRWIDHHGCPWITCQDIRERQKHAGRCVCVHRLQQHSAYGSSIELGPHVIVMVPGCHDNHPLPGRQFGRSVEGMLKHRAGADEGAVLFRFVVAEPLPDEFLGPNSVTS
jgi:hypothetical protein